MRAAVIKSSMMFPNCSLIAFLGKMLVAAAELACRAREANESVNKKPTTPCESIVRAKNARKEAALLLNMGLINKTRRAVAAGTRIFVVDMHMAAEGAFVLNPDDRSHKCFLSIKSKWNTFDRSVPF